MNKRILHILCVAALMLTACSSNDNMIEESPSQQPSTGEITLTATLAPKGDNGSTTRAITTGKDGENKEILNVAWEVNEQIALFYQTTSGYAKTTATVQSVDATTHVATIEATITGAIDGGTVEFVYPASLANDTGIGIDVLKLRHQNGNLTDANGISTKFDAATGDGKIKLNGGTALPTTATVTNNAGTGNITMTNRVCICKFHFDIAESAGTSSSTSSGPEHEFNPITINDGNGHTYTITSDRTNGYATTPRGFTRSDDIYVAMLPVTNKTVTFSTTYNSSTYSYTATHTILEAGKFYRNLGTIQLVKGGYTHNVGIYSTVNIPAGGTYTLSSKFISVSSGPAIQCLGYATIILEGSNFVSTSATDQPAILVPEECTLTIKGTGSLTATGGYGGAGIGGGSSSCGNIIIESGTVTANGGSEASGIGSSKGRSCGNITISGGVVNAQGGQNFAGIGTKLSSSSAITINGGIVTATGGGNAPGIGSGGTGSRGIIINDGTVTATGGIHAAGIGSGNNGRCDKITINGGTVTANGGIYSAGIGSGNTGICGDITISGTSTHIKAIKGNDALYSIGKGINSSTCGTVTIGGTVYYDGTNFQNDGETYLANSPLLWQWPTE